MESASSPLAPTSTRGGGDNGAGALLSWDLWAAENWAAAASSNPTAASHYHNSTHPCYHYHGQHGVTCAYAPPQPLPFTDCQHQQELARYHYAGTNGGYSTAADLAHHHLTCLKLGKRHYYEEAGRAPVEAPAVAPAAGKKATAAASPPLVSSSSSSSSAVTSSTAAVVPKCQVEGCNALLTDAKDYHKRHKVCETHSKAPKVVVLGLEQRFCQQCSRFHVISEFDDAKRSCRRRLAGHNERRRKSSNEAIVRNTSFDYISAMGGRFPYIPSSTSSPGRALSLLSTESSAWSHSELSSQSSAALRELIAENRAALLARQLFLDRDCHGAAASVQDNHFHQQVSCYPHLLPAGVPTQLPMGWDNFRDVGSHVTLDLMQVPNSSYEALSPRRSKSNSKEDDEENCCGIWKSLAGTHVV